MFRLKLRQWQSALLAIAVLAVESVPARAELVTEIEALRVADQWMTMELRSVRSRLSRSESDARLAALDVRSVAYVDATGSVTNDAPTRAIAYVIAYEARGFVVVAGDDRLEPIISFDVAAPLRTDEPQRNFMLHFLARELPPRWTALQAAVASGQSPAIHPNWERMRRLLESDAAAGDENDGSVGPRGGSIYILWPTAVWNQSPYYNDEVVRRNGNIAGIPTGCTATAMAIKMQFHQWPPSGSGSHGYSDLFGEVRFSHNVNFSNQSYDWSNMPASDLAEVNDDIADLMYHCGVAVDMQYETDVSGAWLYPDRMNYFRFNGTAELWWDHDAAIIRSLRAQLPVIISSSAHTVIVTGYRNSPAPFYYFNCGWGGFNNGWYNLDEIPVASDPTIDRSYPYSKPASWIFADANWSGFENGELTAPYSTLAEAAAAAPNGGRVLLRAGDYTATIFQTRQTFDAFEGSAIITR